MKDEMHYREEYRFDRAIVIALSKLAKQYRLIEKLLMKWMYVRSDRRLHPLLGKAVSGIGHFCLQEDHKGFYHICDRSNHHEMDSNLKNECGTCMRLAENNTAWECYYWVIPIRKIDVGDKIKNPMAKRY